MDIEAERDKAPVSDMTDSKLKETELGFTGGLNDDDEDECSSDFDDFPVITDPDANNPASAAKEEWIEIEGEDEAAESFPIIVEEAEETQSERKLGPNVMQKITDEKERGGTRDESGGGAEGETGKGAGGGDSDEFDVVVETMTEISDLKPLSVPEQTNAARGMETEALPGKGESRPSGEGSGNGGQEVKAAVKIGEKDEEEDEEGFKVLSESQSPVEPEPKQENPLFAQDSEKKSRQMLSVLLTQPEPVTQVIPTKRSQPQNPTLMSITKNAGNRPAAARVSKLALRDTEVKKPILHAPVIKTDAAKDDGFDDTVFLSKVKQQKAAELERKQAPTRRQLRPSLKQKKILQKKTKRRDTLDIKETEQEQGLVNHIKAEGMASDANKPGEAKEDDDGDDEEEKDVGQEEMLAQWNNITAVRKMELKKAAKAEGGFKALATQNVFRALPYTEAESFFGDLDLREYEGDIKTSGEATGLRKISFMLFGRPKLKSEKLQKDRDQIFLLAKAKLNHENEIQTQLLQTLYKLGTSDSRCCPKFGPHWSALGFQGNDPSTDLRGAGLFGLMNLLYLLEREPKLAHRLLSLARCEEQMFPFAVVGFNFTGTVLQVLRDGKIFHEINSRNSVYEVCNDLYAAIYYKFLLTWKNNMYTIIKFGSVRQEIEKQVRKNPMECITAYRKYQGEQKARDLCEDEDVVTPMDLKST